MYWDVAMDDDKQTTVETVAITADLIKGTMT